MYIKPKEYKKKKYYHVFNRGHHKDKLFLDDKDYSQFTYLILKYSLAHDIIVVSYCLMPNHFHFVIKLGESKTEISKFMQRLKTAYASYFNRKYFLVGTPYQGRFQAREVQDKEDLHQLINYIKNNPVEAGYVEHYEDYKWLNIKRKHL